MPKLVVLKGYDKDRVWELPEGETTVGRRRENRVVLSDPRISRLHFTLYVGGEQAILVNHSVTHGTYVNGIRVVDNIQLDHRDQIKAGETVMELRLREPGGARPETSGGERSTVSAFEESHGISLAGAFTGEAPAFEHVAQLDSTSIANLAGRLTDAAERAHLQKRLMLIQEIGQQLVAQLDLRGLFKLILDKVFELMRVDMGAILLFDAGRKSVVPVYVRNRRGPVSAQELRLSRTMVQYAVRQRVAVLSADTQSDERFQEQMSVIAHGIRSAMCVPLAYLGEILGVVYVDNVITDYAFQRDDLNLLTILANQAAIALRNARLHRQIVSEETKRANLARYLTPQLVERVTSQELQLKLGGDKVQVAVLFSDIRDFTSLSETMPPDQVLQMLNSYFSEMTETIFEFQGTLDKYVGDAIIAAFGSPVPDERACLNALACAATMMARLPELTFAGPSFSIGLGLHYGEVIHGNVGSETVMQYTLIGDTVNTASRLCDLARGGQILFSEVFLEQVRREAGGRPIEAREIEPVKLKGKATPLKIYEFTGGPQSLAPHHV